MLSYKNTTSIPDMLVAVALQHAKEMLAKRGESVPIIDTISLRNKEAGKIGGNWGKYYANHPEYGRCITLCVPEQVSDLKSTLPHSRYPITFADKMEWLVAIISHEMKHAWQFQISVVAKRWAANIQEYDAEMFEVNSLDHWRSKMLEMKLKVASNSSK